MTDQQKVVFSMTYAGFKVTAFFDAEYLRNGTRYNIVSMKYI